MKYQFNGFPVTCAPEKYPELVERSDLQLPKQAHDLETFINSMESDITQHKHPTPKHNKYKPFERSALHSLQKREGIIIKPADNGSAVVVMDRGQYVSEAERQLT